MKRNLQHLANRSYDVLIIGAGIYGAWAAWDAAVRGFSVALLEKDDFGSATSSNSLKIIHGGLRYLQHADFKRMRESIHERMVLMRVAPHLVHPLPCVMPTYGHGTKGREALAMALVLNDLVSIDRNRLSDPQKYLPKGKIISKKKTLEIIPGIETKGLTGGAIWYDCQIHNSERLLISLLKGAADRGAEIANYAPVQGFIQEGQRIKGVRVNDALSGKSYEITAKMVVNTTGPWVNKLLSGVRQPAPLPPVQFSKAMNLVVKRRITRKYGVGIPSKYAYKDAHAVINRGSRLLFLTPWRRYTLIGTTHVPYFGDPDEFAITEQDIQEFLDEYNAAYPAQHVRREEVCYFYGGLLPMESGQQNSQHVTLTKHYRIIDHEKEQHLQGLVTVVGVKYTTARDVISRTMDLVSKKLQKKSKSQTEHTPIPGGKIDRFGEFLQEEIAKRPWGLNPSEVRHLVYNYGKSYPEILQYIDENVQWRERVDADQEVLFAEVVHAIREEMAIHLIDVIRRRTELGSAGPPTQDVLKRVAALMATELGWDEGKQQEEIEQALKYYQPGMKKADPVRQNVA
ncbi:MAG: glycerol-3-phosphate dehydrogenase/oxidase [Calditrichaeota bacterium]|nr:MAG: glycerol-3-phosphate dehydrogenase/oxidase [Calditrichota bacterium]